MHKKKFNFYTALSIPSGAKMVEYNGIHSICVDFRKSWINCICEQPLMILGALTDL